MGLICSQLDINYPSIIQTFVSKSECESVCVVMDSSSNLEFAPTGIPSTGYECPTSDKELPQGLKSWPAVYSFPETPLQHWPNVISLIHESQPQLDKYKEPIHWWEPTLDATYFITKVDPRIFILVLFNKKKKKNDQVTNEFLFVMATHLRNWKVFSKLKPVIR